jgi:hypothetical protein
MELLFAQNCWMWSTEMQHVAEIDSDGEPSFDCIDCWSMFSLMMLISIVAP